MTKITQGQVADAFLTLMDPAIPVGSDVFLKDITGLVIAARASEWKLIADTAIMFQEGNAEAILAFAAKGIARDIFVNFHDYHLDHPPSKGDILDILRVKFPRLHETIPTSTSGLNGWWKGVDCLPKQARGNMAPAVKDLLDDPDWP